MATVIWTGPHRRQDLGIYFRSPNGLQGFSNLTHPPLLSQVISRELVWKWNNLNNWELNQCLSVMLTLQACLYPLCHNARHLGFFFEVHLNVKIFIVYYLSYNFVLKIKIAKFYPLLLTLDK